MTPSFVIDNFSYIKAQYIAYCNKRKYTEINFYDLLTERTGCILARRTASI